MTVRAWDRIRMSFEGVGIALDAMRANKVRATLTISGVAVGVFVVVAMAATVTGIERSFRSDVDEFGAGAFQLRRRDVGLNACDGSDDTCPDLRNPVIRLDDWRAVRQLPEVETATAFMVGEATFTYGARQIKSVGFDAESEDWILTDQADIQPGRSFSRAEHDAAASVLLVNDSLKAQLFGDSDPVGKQIGVDGKPFTVIGVFHTKAGFLKSMDNRGPDRPRAMIPMLTAWRRLSVGRSLLVLVKPRAGVARDIAMDAVTGLMRARRGLRPAQPNNFALVGEERMMELFDQLFGAIFLVGIALSGVGLLVGGVGVVAIMMISVTERTREIGVRKALGATRATVLWQFLVEAATMTSIGAAIGLLIGTGAAALIRSNTSIPAAVPPSAVVTALAAAALTGIAFGMAPASRASRLDPVEALRHE